MWLKTYPKLNIFLKILGQEGRYHLILSRFRLVDHLMYDAMRLSLSSRFRLEGDFDCPWEQNLITKAIRILKSEAERTASTEAKILDALKIEVEKKIPTGAGLGSASSNAGVLLRYLNETYFHFSNDRMQRICKAVGADVSFFYSGFSSANVSGIGEVIEAFQEEVAEFEIFTPKIHCDTSKVYQRWDDLSQGRLASSADSMAWRAQKSSEILKSHSPEELNDLLKPALSCYEALSKIREDLGSGWFFSGSGSSFFRLRHQNSQQSNHQQNSQQTNKSQGGK